MPASMFWLHLGLALGVAISVNAEAQLVSTSGQFEGHGKIQASVGKG